MEKLMGYLRLMRVPNIITAISDVLAGVAIAGSFVFLSASRGRDISYGQVLFADQNTELLSSILLLVLATIGLYGGGVVLNDVFDAELDKIERPERPIPSGLISKTAAAIFGTSLLILGVVAAALTHWSQFFSAPHIIAFSIAVAAVVYDKWMKHHNVLGPLNMGICRGLNLILGMSMLPFAIQTAWYLALIPVVYIAAITMISRGEVHGGKKNTMYFAFFLYSLVILSISFIAYNNAALLYTIPFQLLHAIMVFVPLQKAVKDPRGPNIGKAVKNGVIGLIAMNASFAAAHNDLYFAVLIIFLLPLSILLARLFAVT